MKGANGHASCLVGAGEAEDRRRQPGAARAQAHREQEERGHDHVVGAEDLLPVDERVHGHGRRRGQAPGGVVRQAAGQRGGQGPGHERHQPRIERAPAARAARWNGIIRRCVPGRYA
jgi:hypothetical protein